MKSTEDLVVLYKSALHEIIRHQKECTFGHESESDDFRAGVAAGHAWDAAIASEALENGE